jgi:predicted secreted protein
MKSIRREHNKVKNPKKPTYSQRKESMKLGYDPKDHMVIAAPPHEFTLLHIKTGEIITVERII